MTKNIFISYRRGDSEGIATLLFDRIQDYYDDIRVIMDVSDFNAGGNKLGVIGATIKSCKVMLLLIGPNWELAKDEMGRNRLDDPHDFVRVEVQSALNWGILIIPVLVNREKMPKQDDLPHEIRDLMKFDPIVIHSRRFDENCNSLLTAMDGYLGKIDHLKRKSPIVDEDAWSIKKRRMLYGLTIVVIFILVFWLRLTKEKDVDISGISEEVKETSNVVVDAKTTITPKTHLNESFVVPTQTQPIISTETYSLKNIATPSPTSTSTYALLNDQIFDPAGISMVLIPQGPFIMGTNDDESWDLVSRPAATIGLDVFYIDKYEVSNGQYADCVLENVCNPPSKERSKTRLSYYGDPAYVDYPVIYVSWNDASTYCSWRGGRLPFEAEWEKAARGENAYTYPWGDEAADCQYANFTPNNACVGDTSSVRGYSRGASPYGVINLSGNVYEWVQDWFQAYPGGSTDATKDFDLTKRVVRGGGYFDGLNNIRTTSRSGLNPEFRYSYVGFRCVIDIEALP